MDASVQAYLDAVSDERRALMERLSALIMRLYPDSQAVLWYRVPTFRTPTGHISIGYWKGGVSLYPGRRLSDAFRQAHPEIKTRTGTINLKMGEPFPEEALVKIIRSAMEGGR